MNGTDPLTLAGAVRNACVLAALDAYENAQISGLCQEGAWEVAIDAMRMLDLRKIVETSPERSPPPRHGPASA
ncbi:MAG: hypothetical protein K9K30_06160 [Burkholderiaceae bacterium]|nr:hypothetical protein [Sulfuritalea sp.]MCF8174809.1 hypothetical protein [Burkholderiaceae bacterium]